MVLLASAKRCSRSVWKSFKKKLAIL